MVSKGLVAAALAVLALSSGTASAQTLAQKQMMGRQDAQLADEVSTTNKMCGASIAASVDWPTFLATDTSGQSVSSFCAEPLRTMGSMCSDPIAKQAISTKVKTYQCSFGGPGKRSLALDGTALHMEVDWDAANYDQFIRAWLGDHL